MGSSSCYRYLKDGVPHNPPLQIGIHENLEDEGNGKSPS